MILPYTSSLRITNVPADLKGRYLICTTAPKASDGYVAKVFKAILPRAISPFEVVIDFGPGRPHVTK